MSTLRNDWRDGEWIRARHINEIVEAIQGCYVRPATGIPAADLAAGASSEARPNIYHIDDYGGDPTGATDSNQALIDAYTAMGSGPGIIKFGVGKYLLYVGLNEASSRVLAPRQGVRGEGSGQSIIDYRGTGAFLEFRDLDFDNTTVPHQHGGCHGLQILGWNNGNSNTCGIRYGDMWRMRISDVEVTGFNQPGGKGLWGDNHVRWSERAFIECVANQCTEAFVFESNTGDPGSGSFDYSQYWLSFVIMPNQHGFVLRSGTTGSKVSMNGASVTLTGNCQLAAAGGTNNGAMFRVGKDNADAANFSGQLQIGVETSGTIGGVAHFDFMQGDGPFYDVQSRVTASGSINLIPYSGSRFQPGNATPRTFSFGGLLKGSSALGSTSSMQSFQPLQLVSDARGGTFFEATNCIQTIYVTTATGGTFTLSFGGYTTTPLAYNATPTQVEAALRALPSIGATGVTVSQGQARFINSVAADERAFVVVFGGPLASTSVALLGHDSTGLTGTMAVVMKSPGSANQTYVFQLEGGSIFVIEPTPGTYRTRLDLGGLTAYGSPMLGGDSPFGLKVVDIWVKQPDTGGPVFFESPYFTPYYLAGSTYRFQWMDGQEPILSSQPGAMDIIRLTSYNYSSWVGQHLTRLSTTNVPPPATSTSPGIKGQIAYDADYQYTCIADNTWKHTPLTSW
jgi:hypothetical protein